MKTVVIALLFCAASTLAWADTPRPAPDSQVTQLQRQVRQLQTLVQVIKQQRDQANDQLAVALAQQASAEQSQAPAPEPKK